MPDNQFEFLNKESEEQSDELKIAADANLWEASRSSFKSVQNIMKNQIGEILISMGKISDAQLKKALAYQKKKGGLVGKILMRAKYINDTDLSIALQKQCLITTVSLNQVRFKKEAIEALPPNVCQKYKLIPFQIIGNIICIAMSNPLDAEALTKIRCMVKQKVKVFNCAWGEIRAIMVKCFEHQEEIPNLDATKLVRDIDLRVEDDWSVNKAEAFALEIKIPKNVDKFHEIKTIPVEVIRPMIARSVDRVEFQKMMKGTMFDVIRKWEITYGTGGPFPVKQMAG